MGAWRWTVQLQMKDFKELPNVESLLDVRGLGAYLGRPWRSLERQLRNPPKGFPPPIRLGRLVFWCRPQVDAWLRGETPGNDLEVTQPIQRRGRGRPLKQPVRAGV
jgi:predicted DNA-binding transcriptional regulator AlpA